MIIPKSRLSVACLVSSIAAFASPAMAQLSGVFPTAAEVRTVNRPVIENTAFIDCWSTPGSAYVAIPGRPSPAMVHGSAMPVLAAPINLGTAVASVTRQGNTPSTLSGTVNCQNFSVRGGHTLRIQGDVIIHATQSFKIENRSRIELLDGATLTVYTRGSASIENNVDVNMNTWDPKRVTFVHLGTGDFTILNSVRVCASFAAPSGGLLIRNNSDIFGHYVGRSLSMRNSAALHVPGEARRVKFASGSSVAD